MTTAPTDLEIETVAKALIARELGDPDLIFHGDNTPMWHAWREDARAAIEALDALRAGSVSDAPDQVAEALSTQGGHS